MVIVRHFPDWVLPVPDTFLGSGVYWSYLRQHHARRRILCERQRAGNGSCVLSLSPSFEEAGIGASSRVPPITQPEPSIRGLNTDHVHASLDHETLCPPDPA